jgi:hypothetical protein
MTFETFPLPAKIHNVHLCELAESGRHEDTYIVSLEGGGRISTSYGRANA